MKTHKHIFMQYRIVKWLTQDLIKVPEQNVKQNSRFLK